MEEESGGRHRGGGRVGVGGGHESFLVVSYELVWSEFLGDHDISSSCN